MQEIQNRIEELLEKYNYVGIHTSVNEIDQNKEIKSYAWSMGDKTDEELNGLSCTDVNGNWKDPHFNKKSNGSGWYAGDYHYIVCGEDADYGEDVHEIVIKVKHIEKI